MRFGVAVVFAVALLSNGAAATQMSSSKTSPEDAEFFTRLLRYGEQSMQSMPTQPPTNGPTNLPTASPTTSPTAPPSVPGMCAVDVTITCTDAAGTDCNAIPPRETDCLEEVTYGYSFENVGTDSMEITEVMRTRGGSVTDLIRLVNPTKLEIGVTTVVIESETVNFCTDGTFETVITAKADPPQGVPCEDTAAYIFTIESSPSPSSAPSSSPSSAPSPAPSSPPSVSPSSPPSPSPSSPPSTAPSSLPSPLPSSPPSPAPSIPGMCAVDVTVTCMDAAGTDCAAIPPRETDCFEEVTYMYNLANVGDNAMDITEVLRTRGGNITDLIGSVNPKSLALGESTKVMESETVNFCADGTFETIITAKADPPQGVPCEDTATYVFTIEASRSPSSAPSPVPSSPPSLLPSSPPSLAPSIPGMCAVDVAITCMDAAGTDCAAIPSRGTDCLEEVTYVYTFANVGDNSMNITEVLRTRGGIETSLIGLVDPTNLPMGESTTVTESETVNFCIDGTFETTLTAKADPPQGIPCEDAASYVFSLAVVCLVETEITCVDANGVECMELKEPDGVCSDGDVMTILRINYIGGNCGQSSNQQGDAFNCIDEGEGPPTSGSSVIDCTGTDGNTIYSDTVAVGDPFNLGMESATLPSSVTCTITSLEGNLAQTCTFDPSGESTLSLKDVFCSLEVEACTDNTMETKDCFTEVIYTYDFNNVGTDNMTITGANRTRGDDFTDLLPELSNTELSPGTFVSATDMESVDLCIEQTFCTVLEAEAKPPTLDTPCFDESKYIFTTEVVCQVDLEIGCVVQSGDLVGQDCRMLEGETFPQCTGSRPTELCFVYTASPCSDPAPGLVECRDFDIGPQFMADITVTNGNVVLTSEMVMIGSQFCVGNGVDALPENIFINVSNAMGGLNPVPYQITQIDTSCSGRGLTLLDVFGASEFVGYTNDNGVNDCLVDVEYEYVVTNIGNVNLTISELARTFNGSDQNLILTTDPAVLMIGPTNTFSEKEPVRINRCTAIQYITSSTVVAEGDDGAECSDADDYAFDIVVGTPFPTTSPSASPSNPPTLSPTPSPTSPPSASPSDQPTPTPTPSPTTPPSASPSDQPTPAPTQPPSPSPSDAPSPVPTPIVFPPGDSCFVQVGVDCTPPPGVEDCDSIPIPRDECLEKVFSLGFRYNGGDCSQSSNVQDPQLFQCRDFAGGPPIEPGAESYFLVQDIKGLGIIYFEGFVAVGGEFTVANQGALLGANVNMTIYDTNVIVPSNIRQTMIIHTSCSQVTFLKDRYGSAELLSFNNTIQGFVSCFVDVSLGFNVVNVVEGFNVILETLTSITNFEEPSNFLNFTEDVAGVQLGPGETLPPLGTDVTIDLSVRKLYTVFTTVQGASEDGFSCRSTDFLEFTAGLAEGAP